MVLSGFGNFLFQSRWNRSCCLSHTHSTRKRWLCRARCLQLQRDLRCTQHVTMPSSSPGPAQWLYTEHIHNPHQRFGQQLRHCSETLCRFRNPPVVCHHHRPWRAFKGQRLRFSAVEENQDYCTKHNRWLCRQISLGWIRDLRPTANIRCRDRSHIVRAKWSQ